MLWEADLQQIANHETDAIPQAPIGEQDVIPPHALLIVEQRRVAPLSAARESKLEPFENSVVV